MLQQIILILIKGTIIKLLFNNACQIAHCQQQTNLSNRLDSDENINFKSALSSLGFNLMCLLNCTRYASLNASDGIRFIVPEARVHQCLLDNPYDTSQPPLVRINGLLQPIVISYAMFMTELISFEGEFIAFDYTFFYFWNDAYRCVDQCVMRI